MLSSAVMTRSKIPMKNRSLNPARKARIYRTILPLGGVWCDVWPSIASRPAWAVITAINPMMAPRKGLSQYQMEKERSKSRSAACEVSPQMAIVRPPSVPISR